MQSIRVSMKFDHIKAHYFSSHSTIDPQSIISGRALALSYLDEPLRGAKIA
jgi:glutathionyl-hydroquinone reductase